ncbi:MAG: hypothetical protein ACTSX9_04205 [Candidatus Njordarchaeales archaeon]
MSLDLSNLYSLIRDKDYLLEKCLLLLPSIAYNYHEIYEEVKDRVSELGRRSLVLLGEAALFLEDNETFARVEKLFNYWFSRDPKEVLELASFMIIRFSKDWDKFEKFFDRIAEVLKNIGRNKGRGLASVNLFFELFFRYAFLFSIEIDNILEKVYGFYQNLSSVENFYQVLTAYLRHSLFLKPPHRSVLLIYEKFYEKIAKKDVFNIPFVAALILALKTIGKEKLTNDIFKEVSNEWIVYGDSSTLFSFSRRLLGRTGLLFALTREADLDQFISEASKLVQEFSRILQYLLDFQTSLFAGESFSPRDLDEFTEYAMNFLKEKTGAKEVQEDVLFYVESVANNLSEAIDSLIYNIYNSMLATRQFNRYSNLLQSLQKLYRDSPEIEVGFHFRLRNSLAMLLSVINGEWALESFRKSVNEISNICKRDRECLAWLSNDLGVKLGYAAAISENNEFVTLLCDAVKERRINKRQLIRGFASSLYGVISVLRFGRRYREIKFPI